ncbi:MAG: membrane protein insertion efficiency factor YidD [Halomonadaceae bacterium]|nr:MAG: membrane protein insertion efficiency factor YidD [Halomonadaceae bacterium]
MIKRLIVLLIRGYQYGISPLLPSRCRFYPTCSSYAVEAVEHHGVAKGLWLALKRLARCHPWGNSGYDPVPGCGKQQHCPCDPVNRSGPTHRKMPHHGCSHSAEKTS